MNINAVKHHSYSSRILLNLGSILKLPPRPPAPSGFCRPPEGSARRFWWGYNGAGASSNEKEVAFTREARG